MFGDAFPKEANLKNGQTVTIRLLQRGDLDKLLAFFQSLPEQDRLFLQHNVTDPKLIRKWTERLDFDRTIPLVAEVDGRIVADGTLHLSPHGWAQHVGQIRLVIASAYRQLGLGTLIARELVLIAEERDLEKLYANVIEDDAVSVKLLQRLGFKTSAVLKDLVKDQTGKKRNMAIMMNDVSEVGRVLEDWIQDSLIPEFRGSDGFE
jgi:RimJ/RimL family protein N-acetyltransferase